MGAEYYNRNSITLEVVLQGDLDWNNILEKVVQGGRMPNDTLEVILTCNLKLDDLHNVR